MCSYSVIDAVVTTAVVTIAVATISVIIIFARFECLCMYVNYINKGVHTTP